jgi:hypothetical protein
MMACGMSYSFLPFLFMIPLSSLDSLGFYGLEAWLVSGFGLPSLPSRGAKSQTHLDPFFVFISVGCSSRFCQQGSFDSAFRSLFRSPGERDIGAVLVFWLAWSDATGGTFGDNGRDTGLVPRGSLALDLRSFCWLVGLMAFFFFNFKSCPLLYCIVHCKPTDGEDGLQPDFVEFIFCSFVNVSV